MRITLDFVGFIKVIEMDSAPPRIKIPIIAPFLIKDVPEEQVHVEYLVFRCICLPDPNSAYYVWSGNER